MYLFLCETKSQIINAIALKMSLFKDQHADVCLVRKVAMPVIYEEKMKSLDLFDNVFSIEEDYYPEQDIKAMLKKGILYITLVDKISKKLQGKLGKYERVFVSGLSITCPAIYYGIKKKNKSVKLSLYEEGTFEYYIFQYPPNKIRRWYSKLFYGSFYIDEADELYVYAPEMVVTPATHIKVKPIPKIFNNREFRNCVDYVFDYCESDLDALDNCICLFLESCYTDSELSNMQHKLIKLLFDIIGDRFFVKLHPRSDIHKYDSIGVKRLKTNQSMEMILCNANFNIEDIVYLSPLSSAMLNIKFMFGKEPRMILLNQLFNMSTNVGGIQYLAENFVKQYPQDKMYHPDDLDSFIKTIRIIFKDNV